MPEETMVIWEEVDDWGRHVAWIYRNGNGFRRMLDMFTPTDESRYDSPMSDATLALAILRALRNGALTLTKPESD